MIRVLIAAESAVERQILVDILSADPGFDVVAQAETGFDTVDLALELKPDVVAMNLDLPLLDGVAATREIMARSPTRIVVLSDAENRADLDRGTEAIMAGAIAVGPKPEGPGMTSRLRRQIFLEMVRSATQMLTPPSFALEPSAEDGFAFLLDPFTVEDRAERIRRLLDQGIR